MSVESIEPPKSKAVVIIGILVGLLNTLLWVKLGSLIASVKFWQVSIWWVLFCLILNTGVAFAVSQQRTRPFRRSYWITGVTLFVTITCAFILGFWTGYGATDFGGLAFLSGAAAGGIIGFLIGIVVGINTSPSKFSNVNIVQRIGEGIVTSTIIGIVITAISVFIFATFTWFKGNVESPNYPDLMEHVFFNVLLTTPAGAIPSVITGVTTTLAIYVVNWWFKRQSPIPYENVG